MFQGVKSLAPVLLQIFGWEGAALLGVRVPQDAQGLGSFFRVQLDQ